MGQVFPLAPTGSVVLVSTGFFLAEERETDSCFQMFSLGSFLDGYVK